MPTTSKDAVQQTDPGSLADTIEKTVHSTHAIQEPMVYCGVNRKVNIGNYENVDVYCGVSVPLSQVNDPSLSDKISEAVTYGFSVASKETFERYMAIKKQVEGDNS